MYDINAPPVEELSKEQALERLKILASSEEARNLEWRMCQKDPLHFIFNPLKYTWTRDEHDAEHPIKPLPPKDYLRLIIDQIHKNQVLLIPKSRQLMVTWVISMYLLWDAIFKGYRLNIIQSKKEEDAANLTFNKNINSSRISFALSRIPKWLLRNPDGSPLRINRTYCRISFSNGSSIWGIPQGGDVIRSNTASIIFSDEAAFQPEFEAAYMAAQPSVRGGGKFISVSSANPSFFEQLSEAQLHANA